MVSTQELLTLSTPSLTKILLDLWMGHEGQPQYEEREIERKEGGQGPSRIKTVEAALARPETYPGRWFTSKQTDESFYETHEYVYSLWWACKNFSGAYYDAIARDQQGKIVADIGGSIFSAILLAQGGVGKVMLYNLASTPQIEFAYWIIDRLGLQSRIQICDSEDEIHSDADAIVMKAYLEHFKYVDPEVYKWCAAQSYTVYAANSFCEIAYGHHIPINVGGNWYQTRDEADWAFRALMGTYGYLGGLMQFQPKSKLWRFSC